MDSYEATNMVFTKIQNLDPENASKIMGFILIQDPGEKELIRLALGPETLLQTLIHQAKACLGLSSNTSPATSTTPSSPTPFNPITRPNPLSLSSPRILNNGGFNLTNPSSPASSPWFPSDLRSPNGHHGNNHLSPISTSSSSLSYAAVVNSGNVINAGDNGGTGSSSSLSLSAPASFYNNNNSANNNGGDLFDDYQLQDHLSFLNESKTDDLFDPRLELAMGSSPNSYHRRSMSLNDACYGGGCEDGSPGFGGWRPCMYFARGFCKNGSSCNFRHSGFADSSDVSAIVGSPSKLDAFEQSQEILRSRAAAAQQQRMAVASQLMAGASFPYNKCMNFFNDSPRSAAAAALMMGEEFHKFGRCRSERNDFSGMGLGGVNPGSRQIYLTFPADSTFREEDVSNYFSIYGPVQDVRIPYQQKRMFGFVTFVYPETVKLILAKGNPHFVCESRVLVKPYKEKGKVDKKQYQQQQQQFERGELSGCPSPREPYDIHIGPRMFYNAQELMLRRKLEEQADLQQAIELQGRRMMNLQLLDIKNHHHHHQYQHNLSPIDSIPLRIQPPNHMNQNLIPSDTTNQEVPEDDNAAPNAATSPNAAADQQVQQEVNAVCNENNGDENGNAKEESSNLSDFDLNESLEHIFLPDSLFASPTKSTGDHKTVFSMSLPSKDSDESIATSTTSSNSTTLLAPQKSCFFEMPRFSSGHEAIEM